MEKQKYDYKFFVDTYSYKYDSMFRKYYKQQEKKYRYFIIIEEDINICKSTVYRSNETLEEILLELDEMEFQRAKIIDYISEFPNPKEYVYNKFQGDEWVTEEYYLRNRFTGRRNKTSDTWVYKIWHDRKYIYSCTMDDDLISVYYDGIEVSKYNGRNIKVEKYLPLSKPKTLNFDRDVTDKLRFIIKRIQKDNINGFYDDMIEKIKNNFIINYEDNI